MGTASDQSQEELLTYAGVLSLTQGIYHIANVYYYQYYDLSATVPVLNNPPFSNKESIPIWKK